MHLAAHGKRGAISGIGRQLFHQRLDDHQYGCRIVLAARRRPARDRLGEWEALEVA